MNIANEARRLLIKTGKVLPFFLCCIIMVAYCEIVYALSMERYICFWDYTIPDTPINYFIASNLLEVDILLAFVSLLISVAIESCVWNRLATAYIFLNIAEKYYLDFELEREVIIAICAANILVSGFFVYKGVRILTSN